jgi:hypothetical protein
MESTVCVCEVCGMFAERMYAIRDIRELEPVNGFARWEKDGDCHFYCHEHKRPARRFRLDGSVEIEGNQIPSETS